MEGSDWLVKVPMWRSANICDFRAQPRPQGLRNRQGPTAFGDNQEQHVNRDFGRTVLPSEYVLDYGRFISAAYIIIQHCLIYMA
jgi:hypothetical protein